MNGAETVVALGKAQKPYPFRPPDQALHSRAARQCLRVAGRRF